MGMHTTGLMQLARELLAPAELEQLRIIIFRLPCAYEDLLAFDRFLSGPGIMGVAYPDGEGTARWDTPITVSFSCGSCARPRSAWPALWTISSRQKMRSAAPRPCLKPTAGA